MLPDDIGSILGWRLSKVDPPVAIVNLLERAFRVHAKSLEKSVLALLVDRTLFRCF
jgi:hypothetical protein